LDRQQESLLKKWERNFHSLHERQRALHETYSARHEQFRRRLADLEKWRDDSNAAIHKSNTEQFAARNVVLIRKSNMAMMEKVFIMKEFPEYRGSDIPIADADLSDDDFGESSDDDEEEDCVVDESDDEQDVIDDVEVVELEGEEEEVVGDH
jgi:hypothetical protein